jgi:excisionase family DNA binding protein
MKRGEPRRARDQEIMTLYEVAEYLRLHPVTAYRMVKRGDVPAFRIGTEWRFRRKQINRWIADLQMAPVEPKPRARRGPKRK